MSTSLEAGSSGGGGGGTGLVFKNVNLSVKTPTMTAKQRFKDPRFWCYTPTAKKMLVENLSGEVQPVSFGGGEWLLFFFFFFFGATSILIILLLWSVTYFLYICLCFYLLIYPNK